MWIYLQDPVCSPNKLQCVENIEVPSSSSCLKSCSGLMVTSFVKSRENKDFEGFISKDIDDYNVYKINTKYPSGFEGNTQNVSLKVRSYLIIPDFKWNNKMRLVRIFFKTPTFDRITKDQAVKFVDILSGIGGTMGLLTGFSITSGIEILYFVAKAFLNFMARGTKHF